MLPSTEELLQNIYTAKERVGNVVLQTPLLLCEWLSAETGANVFLKLESEQISGSFKLRGACNKLKKLYETEKERVSKEDIVTASSGNHALACAYVADKIGLRMSIYSYLNIAKVKEEKLNKYDNVTLTKYGNDCCEAEVFARTYANENKLHFISPYNDLDVVCGQSTIGLELLSQYKDLDAVFVPVGGGGLISGIALSLKLLNPSIRVIGCQPVNDCAMYKSVKAGRIVEDEEMTDTFSDGTAGNVEPGSVTFDVVMKYVDEWVLVEEDDIKKAVFDMLDKSKKVIEGAAGLTVAAVRKVSGSYKGKNVALIICGGNIGTEKIKQLIDTYHI